MMNDNLIAQLIKELTRDAPDLSRLVQNEDALGRVMEAFEARDAQTVRSILEELQLQQHCAYICRWLCFWHCLKLCRLVCREIPDEPFEIPDLRRFSEGLANLATDEEASKQLVEAVNRQDADTFHEVLGQFELQPFCFFLCYWICHLHCRRFCWTICPPTEPVDEIEPLEEFRQTAIAAAKLAQNEEAFEIALKAVQSGDVAVLQEIFTELELIPCIFICRWICFLHCFRTCQLFCDRFPRRFSVRDFSGLLIGWQKLAANVEVVEDLVVAYVQEDRQRFHAILEEFNLGLHCFILCRWICHFHCGFYCHAVCPPALDCTLEDPKDCVPEEVLQQPAALVVAVRGTAAGADFDHYILEWSTDDVTYQNTNFHYPPIPPGGGTQGNSPVSSGMLAYLETTLLEADNYWVRLTVFSEGGATCIFKTQFSLFKQDVRIRGIRNFTNLDKSEFDPTARFVENFTRKCSSVSSEEEVSFGGRFSVKGSAFLGGCDEKKIKRYTLSYKEGHETNCASGGWTKFWTVEYSTSAQYRDKNMRQDTDNLTAVWADDCIVSIPGVGCLLELPDAVLEPSNWDSRKTPPCELSGLYTLKLDVEAVDGIHYCDLQRIWLDNKPGHAQIQLGGVAACADLNLSDLVTVPDCTVPWPLPLVGIAYDDYIDESLPLSQRPNDNFDYYVIKVTKQGGSPVQIPIEAPDGTCFFGTNRVGSPGDRCDSPGGMDTTGLLAEFDLRALDPTCKANTSYASSIPDSFTLLRGEPGEPGECCVYTFELWVYDTTRRNGSWIAHDMWSVKICNDL